MSHVTVISSPCRVSLGSMSYVEFKKCPCRPVEFRGLGLLGGITLWEQRPQVRYLFTCVPCMCHIHGHRFYWCQWFIKTVVGSVTNRNDSSRMHSENINKTRKGIITLKAWVISYRIYLYVHKDIPRNIIRRQYKTQYTQLANCRFYFQ